MNVPFLFLRYPNMSHKKLQPIDLCLIMLIIIVNRTKLMLILQAYYIVTNITDVFLVYIYIRK